MVLVMFYLYMGTRAEKYVPVMTPKTLPQKEVKEDKINTISVTS